MSSKISQARRTLQKLRQASFRRHTVSNLPPIADETDAAMMRMTLTGRKGSQ